MMKYVKKYKFYIIIFLVTFVPRFILGLSAIPVRTISDEVATISSAAFLAGKDWSNVVSKAGYYGFGYTALFAPLFRITNNPFFLYRTMILGEVLMQAGVGLIAFWLLKKYYKIEDQIYAALCAIACSYMVVTRAMIVYNEHALIFCSWLMAAILLKLTKICETPEQKGKIKYSIILMAILTYTLTLHTRSIAFWLVLAVVFVLYLVSERKDLISWKIVVLFLMIGFPMAKYLVSVVQKKVWQATGNGTLRNDKIKVNFSLDFLSAEKRGAWINIILGQFNTVSLITGGLFFFAIVISVLLFGVYLKKVLGKNRELKLEWNYLIIFLFFGMLILGTVSAQSLTWLKQTKTAMEEGVGTWKYGMKSVTYIRYIGPYLGPVLMVTLAYLKQKKKLMMISVTSLCVTLLVLLVWAKRIYPYVKYNTYALECYLPFSFQNIRNLDMSKNIYIPLSLVAAALVVIFFICLQQKKHFVIAGLLAGFLMYQYCYNAVFYDLCDQRANFELVRESYEWMLENQQQYDFDEIYVIDGREKEDHQTFYLYQFLLNDYKVMPTINDTSDVKILFTNTENCPLDITSGYQCIVINNDQYVWVRK